MITGVNNAKGACRKRDFPDFPAARLISNAVVSVGRVKPLRSGLGETCGAQLVEFALALPFLLVVAMGVIDFAHAYNTKHIMVNAARGAARIMASTPLSNSSCPSGWKITSPGSGVPCAVQTAADSVKSYLTAAGLNTAACLNASSATFSSPMTWTYSCNSVTLVINKAYVVSGGANGYSIPSTRVILSYPYNFFFGRIIGLLVKGATGPSGQVILTSTAVMQNLALNSSLDVRGICDIKGKDEVPVRME